MAADGVIYVFADPGLPGAVKIGADTTWPLRYRAALSHAPRGLRIRAYWRFPGIGGTELHDREKDLQKAFEPWHGSDGREWCRLGEEPVARVGTRLFDLRPVPVLLEPRYKPYDDWREWNDKQRHRQRLFVLAEHGGPDGPRYKVVVTTLFDTAYFYAATYNPFGLRLVAGYEFGPPDVSPADMLRDNRALIAFWSRLMERFAGNVPHGCVGWVDPGTSLATLTGAFEAAGLTAFALDRPKPADAPEVDRSLSSRRIAIGAVPPQTRVDAGDTRARGPVADGV